MQTAIQTWRLRGICSCEAADYKQTGPVHTTIAWTGSFFAFQLNVPDSLTTVPDEGDDMIAPPSSQQGAGAHAGAPHAGAPHAGAMGAPQAGPVSWPREHGERNSINEGRRQLFPPPKQLLHPGAAARLPRMSARHRVRDIFESPALRGRDLTC